MSQGALSVSNGSGSSVRSALNAALARLATRASGTSRPSDIAAGEEWFETDNPGAGVWSLWRYDGASDVLLGLFDTGSHTFTAYHAVALAALPAGTIVGRAFAEYTTNADLTTQIPTDGTIPQNAEGTQVLSQAYACRSATNRVRITVRGVGTSSAVNNVCAALFKDSDANALKATRASIGGADYAAPFELVYEAVPGTTSSVTYKVRVGPNSGTAIRLNGLSTGTAFGGVEATSILIEEIQQ